MTGQTTSELVALRQLSARIGADPLLVQAAGGNTSLKQDGILWVKASGTWLADAMDREIMVPVRLRPLVEAVEGGDGAAEKPEAFVIAEHNPSGLRPSIETTVHALMPQRVVVHVHCVETISIAVQENAPDLLAERLNGIDWAFIPYFRPGLPLARGIMERLQPGTNVLVLGNHGLVVAADTVAEVAALLQRVSRLLAREPRPAREPDLAGLAELAAGSGYRLPEQAQTHGVATDPLSLRIASQGSLYPDHVIFLGVGSAVATARETAKEAVARFQQKGRHPVSVLFPRKGVLMRQDASRGAEALARCLADVTARLDPDAAIRSLTDRENGELLNWDAEKYRQQLDTVVEREP